MKPNITPKALVLCLIAATSAFADEAKVAAPAPAAQPAAAPAAVAPAPTYTEAQLLEEFGWYIGKRTGPLRAWACPRRSPSSCRRAYWRP